MKVPEKILITQDEDTKELSEHWCLRNLTNNPHIEYINKDAFIEKACEWLEYNYTEFLDSSRLGINIEELVKDFRNDF